MFARVPHRAWLLPALAVALLVAAACAARPEAGPGVPLVSASPVGLGPAGSLPELGGRMRFAGGLALSSRDPRFGGLSGLVVEPGGVGLAAVSDRGWFWQARLSYAGDELIGLRGGALGRLVGLDGNHLPLDGSADSEELEAVPGGLAVSFEHGARIWIYAGGDLESAPRALPLPAWLKDAPPNKGLEALAHLKGGRLLAVCERHGPGNRSLAGIWDGRSWRRLYYQRRGDFLPTAAAALADGRVLFLERRFDPVRGVAVRVSAVPARQVAPGLVMTPETWAELAPPQTVDNFEGLAVARRGEKTWLYLISDDNYSPLQRTLLLAFILKGDGK